MRRMLGSKLPASAGAGDGLDVLGDCQGSADWEDDGRDEARIVAALNRIQRSTKLREAPRCIGVVSTLYWCQILCRGSCIWLNLL